MKIIYGFLMLALFYGSCLVWIVFVLKYSWRIQDKFVEELREILWYYKEIL